MDKSKHQDSEEIRDTPKSKIFQSDLSELNCIYYCILYDYILRTIKIIN